MSDLVADATSVSSAASLIARCEALLSALSGTKRSLLEHVKAAAPKNNKDLLHPLYAIFIACYDSLVQELDAIFQIRHAVVHDVFNQGGPIGYAVRPTRLRGTFKCYLNFLLVWQDTFWRAVAEGIEAEKYALAPDGEKVRKDVLTREMRLLRRQPQVSRQLQKVDDSLVDIVHAVGTLISAIEGKRKSSSDQMWPPDMYANFLRFSKKLADQLDNYSREVTTRRKDLAAHKRRKTYGAVAGSMKRYKKSRAREAMPESP